MIHGTWESKASNDTWWDIESLYGFHFTVPTKTGTYRSPLDPEATLFPNLSSFRSISQTSPPSVGIFTLVDGTFSTTWSRSSDSGDELETGQAFVCTQPNLKRTNRFYLRKSEYKVVQSLISICNVHFSCIFWLCICRLNINGLCFIFR